MKSILYLTLKKEWFDMIKSGLKKEEYREIKEYWLKRIFWYEDNVDGIELDWIKGELLMSLDCYESLEDFLEMHSIHFREYTHIQFKNGYAANAPTFLIELKGFDVRPGIEKWGGDPMTNQFVLELGEIIS